MEVGPRSRRYNICEGLVGNVTWEPHCHEVNETLFTLFYTTESGLKPAQRLNPTPRPAA